jgi:peptidoglycan/xylan/chitin deacetylase (PgdA/CDA1 family)
MGCPLPTRWAIAGSFLWLAALPAAAEDGRSALQAACWAPATLAARAGENIPVRRQAGTWARPPRFGELGAGAAQSAPALLGVVRSVALPPGKRLIALTFDLCETAGEIAGYDGAIIDYLRSQRVKATLFTGGQWLISHRLRAAQLLSDPLFEIGTHGWVHRNARLLAGAELAREISAPSDAFAAVRAELGTAQCAAGHAGALAAIPERPRLFRFPFGACDAASLRAVADAGLIAIQWSIATGDPSPARSARAIAEAMVLGARPGAIIIAHANGRGYHTAAALPMAVPALRARGFEFVTLSELLAAGRPIIAATCYDAHPGDTDRYDFLNARHPGNAPARDLTSPHARTAPPLPQ